MERYEYLIDNSKGIKFGKFFSLVNEKHVQSYGELGATNIVNNIVETYSNIHTQLLNPKLNNNILLVGKVQSGKTSNLELLTALAFDNGYNLLVIYGGYDNSLLDQTTNRFKDTFDAVGEVSFDEECPAVFTTAGNEIDSLDEGAIADLLESGKPIIFVSMKRPAAMKKINLLLKKINVSGIKAFIIDDEGDQASLNTSKDKSKDASATYAEIRTMKKVLNDPMYLSVTATPQANIFLNELSALRPDSIRLIQPGLGYQGAEAYHLFENNIVEVVADDDTLDIGTGAMPESLHDALKYFVVASAIKKKITGEKYSDMIIHAFREVSLHSTIYTSVDSYIKNMAESFKLDDDDVYYYYKEFEDCYNTYVDPIIKEKCSFDSIKSEIKNVVSRTRLILKNSKGKQTQGNESLKLHKIYIGGDLLQRGLTFKNLIVTYFTRWASNGGQMDTNLQRARWFGYRKKYIQLCKIFTNSNVAQEFTNLAEIEDDLWEQFAEVEAGTLKIDDILIRSENTKQTPTSKTKVDYKKIVFKNRWIKQRFIVDSAEKCNENNSHIRKLIREASWQPTTAGSTNNSITAHYATLSSTKLKELIELIQNIFDYEPFQKKALLDLIGKEDVPVVLMTKEASVMNESEWTRYRSLYPLEMRIKALQQGADSSDLDKMTYKGDSSVIVDDNKVNIQIHLIEPGYKDGDKLTALSQFMFAVYIPKQKKYFIKGD